MFKSIVYCILILSIVGCNKINQTNNETSDKTEISNSISDDSQRVYICTGGWAECYHIDRNCEGLENCSGSIREITITEAQKIGRRPCGFCSK